MAEPPDEPTRSADDPPRRSKAGKLTDAEASALAGQLGGLASAGLALPDGLRAMAEETGSRRLCRHLRRVADRIERGEDLGEAIAGDNRSFPDHFIRLIEVAQRSGRLVEVLSESARFDRIGSDLARQLLLRLSYPTLLVCAFLGVFQVIAVFVVRDYATIYDNFGVSLPLLTSWLVSASEFASRAGWAIPLIMGLAGLLIAMIARGATRRNKRRIASGLPLIGALWRNAAMAEFSNLLALLLDCRLPMPDALVLAGQGVGDRDLSDACEGAAREVTRGYSLAEASRVYRLFPDGFDRLLSWAEAHEALPEALRLAAEAFEARDRSLGILIGTTATAMAMMGVLLGIFLLVLGLYLPMVKLISELAGGPFSMLGVIS